MNTTSQPANAAKFPRRDANGRVASIHEMLAGVGANAVLGTVLVVAIDGLATLVGSGRFGQISGWLAGILMVWLFVEDFRAWRIGTGRIGVALLAGVIGLLAGAFLSVQLTALPNIFAGAIGVLVAGLIYAVLWFYGIRMLADRIGEG